LVVKNQFRILFVNKIVLIAFLLRILFCLFGFTEHKHSMVIVGAEKGKMLLCKTLGIKTTSPAGLKRCRNSGYLNPFSHFLRLRNYKRWLQFFFMPQPSKTTPQPQGVNIVLSFRNSQQSSCIIKHWYFEKGKSIESGDNTAIGDNCRITFISLFMRM
jgi:hypothetical protein